VSTLHGPPGTPPDGNQSNNTKLEKVQLEDTKKDAKKPSISDQDLSRKKSLRKHHYEDAVRIACGAWGETGQKKKTVTWDKEVPA